MAGADRREVARRRLLMRAGRCEDAELISRTLKRLSEAAAAREPVSDDDASREASSEIRQMRAERRAKDFVTARSRGE